MNQHEWVYGCYTYYLENGYEPGNPEDGVWEKAHWPVPRCLGGTKTILLLRQHHAVQGVLQSEEWQHPCIRSWEKQYLSDELMPLYNKWMSIKNKRARSLVRPSSVTEHCAQMRAARTREGFLRTVAASLHQRWRCTITGHTTTPGPLTNYQRSRGIDTTNRERVT